MLKVKNTKPKVNRKIIKKRTKLPKNAYQKICEAEEKLAEVIFGEPESLLETSTLETEDVTEEITGDEPVWQDPDDEKITVESASIAQKRKLRDAGISKKTNKYANLLKQKHESLFGTPKWAKIETKEPDSDDDILQSCGYISNVKDDSISKTTLEYKKLKDLNVETYSEGPFISSVEFHPTATVGLVAGSSGIFSLFAVDGKRNNKLHSTKLDKFAIWCAKFNPDANEIVLGSAKRSYIYTFDIEKAVPQRIFLPEEMTNMQRFIVSPYGKYIAVSGRFGQVFLLDSKSKEKICTFQQNSKVRALSFTPNNEQLYAHSETGQVSVWDLNSQRIVHRWYDEGCIQGASLEVSPCGKFVATGSFEGIVNLYERGDLTVENPKPKKSVMNLTTCISTLQFNHTSELLGFASLQKDGAFKLLHIGSQTVYSNFPGFEKNLNKIFSMGFSPMSGYLAIGNNKGKVPLYRLKHYANY